MDNIQIRRLLNQAYMAGDNCTSCFGEKRGHIADRVYCTGRVSTSAAPSRAIKFGPEMPRPVGKVPCQIWENT